MLFEHKVMEIDSVDELLLLQAKVVEELPDPAVYVATCREELLQALREDHVFGLYDGKQLIAAAICIRNRDCGGNLGQKCGYAPTDCYTFDAVFVHPQYRGQGLQRRLIEAARKTAKEEGAASMWCTVSPDNPFSYDNFRQTGFTACKTGVRMYGGRIRDILKLEL